MNGVYTIRFSGDISRIVLDDPSYYIEISPTEDDIVLLCIAFQLLLWDLTPVIRVLSNGHALEILLDREVQDSVVVENGNTGKVTLSASDLELVLAYYLRRMRDGMGEVRHIDVDLTHKRFGSNAGLVFRVDKARPPMSGEEARQLLRGED